MAYSIYMCEEFIVQTFIFIKVKTVSQALCVVLHQSRLNSQTFIEEEMLDGGEWEQNNTHQLHTRNYIVVLYGQLLNWPRKSSVALIQSHTVNSSFLPAHFTFKGLKWSFFKSVTGQTTLTVYAASAQVRPLKVISSSWIITYEGRVPRSRIDAGMPWARETGERIQTISLQVRVP